MRQRRLWIVLVSASLAGCQILAPPSVRSVPAESPPVTVGDFTFTGSNNGPSPSQPVSVQVVVTAKNTSDHPAVLDVLGGNCAVLIRVFDRPDRSGPPVFDASRGIECYVPVVHQRLAPGETYTTRSGRYGPNVNFEPGHYYLSAYLIPSDRDKPRIDVPAGEMIVRH
jgi:hypothetical protein